MNVQTLRISGMTCDRCANSIEDALAGVAGVVEAKVSYDEGTARIKTEVGVDSAMLIDAVQGVGIATGASASIPETPGLKDTPYWTSTEALVAEQLPKHLIVYGGSVVALELGQAFLRLGSKVTLIARSTLLSKTDPAIGEGLKAALEGEGMRILTHTAVKQVRYGSRWLASGSASR
jgi:pyruvate/2-oxoglutarate dehydrogenase complex dihydrolipoamide dehydrogenase (E3) component